MQVKCQTTQTFPQPAKHSAKYKAMRAEAEACRSRLSLLRGKVSAENWTELVKEQLKNAERSCRAARKRFYEQRELETLAELWGAHENRQEAWAWRAQDEPSRRRNWPRGRQYGVPSAKRKTKEDSRIQRIKTLSFTRLPFNNKMLCKFYMSSPIKLFSL